MDLGGPDRVMEAGPARYGAPAQARLDTYPYGPLPDTPERSYEWMDDTEKEQAMEKADSTANEKPAPVDWRSLSSDELDEIVAGARTVWRKPTTALTAEQQIVLRCMEIVGPDISPAAHSPKGRKLFRDTVDGLIARVTTGNWPDTNEKR